MKRISAISLTLVLLCLSITATAGTIEFEKDEQGIVNEFLYGQFGNDMNNIYNENHYPAVVLTMTAVHMEDALEQFVFNFNPGDDPIGYIGVPDENNNVIFMIIMDINKKFIMVSVVPKNDYMNAYDDYVTRDEAIEFMTTNCSKVARITYEMVKIIDDLLASGDFSEHSYNNKGEDPEAYGGITLDP